MLQEFNLWAKEGYISTPDGNSIYIWGFNDSLDSEAQLPGPHIIVTVNDEIIINLHNNLTEPVSIVFPGIEGVTYKEIDNSWQPVVPQFSGNIITSMTNYALPGETITYRFIPQNPGTFIYESGTNPHKQVHMGLYGGLVVRPVDFDTNNKTAYGAGTGTEFDREYILLLDEIDPELHKSVKRGEEFDIRKYKPRYWTINGRCASDTMFMDKAGYLPAQPYGSMIKMEPGEKILLRYVGAGIENHPLHLHGNHTRLVGLDGKLLKNAGRDLSYRRFTVLVGAGQCYDMIFEWNGLGYTPQYPIPTKIPGIRNLAVGDAGWTMWNGSAYIGKKGDVPVDVVSFNEVGEYHFMLHSHEEPQITNWGEFPGGMMSMLGVYSPGTLGIDDGEIRR